jgi:lipoprotein-releasing system ATP-binding protein
VQTILAELQNVSKYYQQPGTGNQNMVLGKVCLSIMEIETIAIVGPSGSGKSTLLNLLGTLDRPSSGKIILNGREIVEMGDNQLADIRTRFIGHVFQQHYLLPQLTLLENVLLPIIARKDKPDRKEAHKRAFQLIERVGLTDHIHQFPYSMSVGECQRGAVVRALINKPQLLLADEPTGSLDAENADQIGKLLVELNREQQIAMVIVTHSTDLARLMQTRYRLSSGRLHTIENL